MNLLPKVIAIVGTNASGKSSVGIDLAKKNNGQIVSADSRQIYNGFDLCCGKITEKETDNVKHYLLDVRNVGESYSVADYQREAYDAIDRIISLNKLPIIVGGTGLYVDSIVKGYVFDEEKINYNTRDRLESMAITDLRLMLSPENMIKISSNPSDYNNKRRLVRLIEKANNGHSISIKNAPRFDVLQLGVTWQRDVLYSRIDERLESRIKNGMIEEVKSYLDNGGKPIVMKKLGLEYKYITMYLTGEINSFEEFKNELSKQIKHFAKRQMTWFNRDHAIKWLNMSGDYISEAQEYINEFLKKQLF